MKKCLLFLMIIIIANSCSAPKYYQLCKVSTTSDQNQDKAVAYEDNNCIITYDFWSESITTDNPVMMIPSHSSKNISKFHLKSSPFIDCSTKLYPRTKEIKTTNYSVEDTPLIFRNIIEYRSGSKKAVQVDMKFYISSVTNYPQTAFYKQQLRTDQCGRKTSQLEDYTDFFSPSAFYILYYGTTASGNSGLE